MKIDTVGTYIGEIVESGVGTTKAGKPQWVTRLKAVQKYINEPSDMEFFKLTEPAYVDWTANGEDIVGFLLLFNSVDVFDASTQMMNYEQLQIATGWDGTSFDALQDGSLIGKQILFRVQEKKPYTNPETGKTTGEGELEIGWIDAENAAPERQLKSVDADTIKSLNAKLGSISKKPVAPAKPAAAAKPAATKPGKPAATPQPVAAPVAPPATPSAPAAATPAPKAPPKAKAKPAPVETPAEESAPAFPAETDQLSAWAAVTAANKSGDDTKLQDAWIAGCQEVGGDRDEDDFTPADWAKVRDAVFVKLNAA